MRYRQRTWVSALLILSFLFGTLLFYQGISTLPSVWYVPLVSVTENPFVGLFIGMLATSIIQSSSLSTTLLVVLGGAGVLSPEKYVPLIIGANIGTVITITIDELEASTSRHAFLRAMSTVMLQDLFNFWTALLLLPLLYWQYEVITNPFFGEGYSAVFAAIPVLLPCAFSLILGFSLIALSLRLWARYWKGYFFGRKTRIVTDILRGTTRGAFLSGLHYTTMLQSSAQMTSILISQVTKAPFSFSQVLFFLMGANIGTTMTALFAALFLPVSALQVALYHLLFNLCGLVAFSALPFFRYAVIRMALQLSKAILYRRLFGFMYIFTLFFLVPFLLILLRH